MRVGAIVAIFIAIAVRTIPSVEVITGQGRVHFPGNDPWHYRDRVIAIRESTNGLAVDEVADESGEPLYYWLSYVWTRFGDVVGVHPDVALAVLPVVLAAATVATVGWAALLVSGDERVAVLSMMILAVFPAHTRYTMLGFADHHALDYLLWALILVGLTGLLRAAVDGRDMFGFMWLLSVSTAASMLAWNGAPIFLLAVGGAGVAVAFSSIRGSARGWYLVSITSAMIISSLLAGAVHVTTGWQETLPILAPIVVGIAMCGLTLHSEISTTGAYALPTLAVVIVGPMLAPNATSRLVERVTEDLLGRSGIIEASSPLDPTMLEALALLWFLGPYLFVLPATCLVLWHLNDSWRVVAGSTAALGVVSILQIRFIAELSIVLSIALAASLIIISAEIGNLKPISNGRLLKSQEFRGVVTSLLFVGFVLLSAGFVSAYGISEKVVEDERVKAASVIEENGGGVVLSQWDQSRYYNGIVGNNSASYGFASEKFDSVIAGGEIPNRVDWVVVDDRRLTESYDPAWSEGVTEQRWSGHSISVYELEGVDETWGDRVTVTRDGAELFVESGGKSGDVVRIEHVETKEDGIPIHGSETVVYRA